MNTFSNAFRSEIIRVARKELKTELQAMRKVLSGHRSDIAALKREIKALASSRPKTQPKAAPSPAEPAPPSGKLHRPRLPAQALAKKRAALGLTQKDMARLLGASSLSVYKWESGQVHPRAAQLDRIAEVLKTGKRKALERLAQT